MNDNLKLLLEHFRLYYYNKRKIMIFFTCYPVRNKSKLNQCDILKSLHVAERNRQRSSDR